MAFRHIILFRQNTIHVHAKEDNQVMEGKKYDCKKCGKSFEMKADDKAPECVHCGSKDVKPAAMKADAAPSCAPRGRFT